MVKLIIDDTEIEVPDYYSLLQACEEAGAEIPRFCFHDRLSVAGNCRMCLVEVKGGPPKPIASCAMGVKDLRPGVGGSAPKIYTSSPMVIKARQGVMEFLLINHPLDCPICDQGGECDLQDQAMAYGVDGSRFHENKRAVEDIYLGSLIKTAMTRCIHCTRCVRFITEVAGVEELGAIGRGENMEITTYLGKTLTSELQGNLADICPVGALTARPYAFSGRRWELRKTETIDVMDALGSAIRIDSRGAGVMRILPRVNDHINEEWISDKTRFVCDGLKAQRLDKPYVRRNGGLIPVSWDEAFETASLAFKETSANRIGVIAGDLVGLEDMYAMKDLLDLLGVRNRDCRQDGTSLDPRNGRASYIFNSTIQGIDRCDAILLVGADPRREAAVLNARILRGVRQRGVKVGVIGEERELNYPYCHIGTGTPGLIKLVEGEHHFLDVLTAAKFPLIIIGQGALVNDQDSVVLSACAELALKTSAVSADWNGFSVLHTGASRVGGLDIGFVPVDDGLDASGIVNWAARGDLDVVMLMEADEIDLKRLNSATVIYIGSHGDAGAQCADIIFPVAAYSEKEATYVNTEGRVQRTQMATFPPGEARQAWAVLRALSERLATKLPYDNIDQLRQDMIGAYPHLGLINEIMTGAVDDIVALAKINWRVKIDRDRVFCSTIDDFYLNNPIARASVTMAQVSIERAQQMTTA